jgi:hypothetical protein
MILPDRSSTLGTLSGRFPQVISAVWAKVIVPTSPALFVPQPDNGAENRKTERVSNQEDVEDKLLGA